MISLFYSNNRVRSKFLILKTNIDTKAKVNTLKTFFNNHMDIIRWNIDLEDIDKVLKIETTRKSNEFILIKQIKAFGFYCAALED